MVKGRRALGALLAAMSWQMCVATAGAQPLPMALQFDAAAITGRCDAELDKYRRTKAAMERPSAPGSILAEWNQLSISIAEFANPVYLLQNVSTDRATRDAAQACLEKIVPFETELFQSERLYRRVSTLSPRDAIDASYRSLLIEQFEDTGVTLPPERRARVQQIRNEVEKLDLQFNKTVNEWTEVVPVAESEARGLPPEWIAARKRDADGRLLVTLDYPSYFPFMANAEGEDARRRVWTAKQNEGGPANLELLDRVLTLRHELARLYDLPDYASFILRRRMAQTPAAVFDFLERVKRAVDDYEARELADLRADKAALRGLPPDSVTLYRWDIEFHKERVRRERYRIDQEALRAYFPTDASVRFALRLAEVLYGLTIVEREAPRWHPDVRYYDVFERGADGARGAPVGGFFLDLYPREGKYNHAAAFTVRGTSTHAGRRPISAMIANFNRRGLDHEELETLLHEFGHVLHAVLARTRYSDQSGSIRRDFVEAPSQMFEEWARREEPLKLLAELCGGCPKIDRAMIERLDQARRFGRGSFFARQWQYAMYDMQLHSGPPKQALPAWIELERRSRLGYVEGTTFPAGFTHLFGYAAGYYGYMWSQVMALDMLSPFKGRLMDAEVGRRYRQTILSQGAQRPPQVIVEEFLGRKPDSDAFFLEITGKR